MTDYQINGAGVIRIEDGACIPPDPNNRDWQKYLKWCEQGGVADPETLPVVDQGAIDLEAARHAIKAQVMKTLKLTQEQMDILFGPNGDPIP